MNIIIAAIIIVIVAITTVAVSTVIALKAVGAKKEDFITHTEIVSGTYMGEREIWMVNGTTVVGVYSPVTVAACTSMYACASADAYGNVAMAYDKNFVELEDKEKYAIVCHEVGHVCYKHKGKRKLEKELQADAYAVEIVGKDTMISALKKILAHKRGKDKELVARITRLGEYK